MSRKKASIPILGIDERPNERQNISGLADEIKNLRPDGLKEEPYWVPIAEASVLKNTSDEVFNHINKSQIVSLYWHTRGKVGKYGAAGSLKRLVILFSTGVVEVVDPESSWGTIVSYTATSTESGNWSGSFTQMYDTGYLCVSKGNVPVIDLIIEDDLIIENVFPELPDVDLVAVPGEEVYTQEEIDAGTYEGFSTGFFMIRYAFRLADGTLVKHSAPEIKRSNIYDDTTDGAKRVTSYLKAIFKGYVSDPANLSYWNDKIKGISILISEFSTTYRDDLIENSIFYELDSFDFIDDSDVETEEKYRTIKISDSSVASLPVADIDDATHHKYGRSTAITYNSRLITGAETTNFVRPFIHSRERFNYRAYIYSKDGYYYVIPSDGITSLTLTVDATNCTANIDPIGSAFRVQITNKSSGWTAVFNIVDRGLRYKATYGEGISFETEESFVKFSEYVDTSGGTNVQKKISLGVVLETDIGEVERVVSQNDASQVWYDDVSDAWWPVGGIISYPDIRAKKLKIYEEGVGVGSVEIMTRITIINLKPSKKANFSFYRTNFVALIDPTVVSIAIDDSVNDKNIVTTNKVRASVINSFLAFESNLVYYIGQTSDRVTGFAVNSLEVSEGQFGQYPLFVFKENSIWALEQSQSADVVFGRITPIDATIGVDKEENITNIGSTIFFANSKGIYAISGSVPQRISEPVQSIHGSIKALGYLRTDNDQELLVAIDTKVYRYSLGYRKWYQSSEIVDHFFSDNELLYALKSDDTVVDYQDESAAEVSTTIVLDHVHYGLYDTLKRYYYFYVRGEVDTVNASKFAFVAFFGAKSFSSVTNNIGSKKVFVRFKAVYEARLVINATMLPGTHQIHKIDSEYSVRYPRKIRG